MLLSLSTYAQVSPRQGVVRDSRTGETLPGVNVTIKGTGVSDPTRGTVTDPDGKFSINAESANVLVFSMIGMTTLEVPVGNQTQLDVRLVEGERSLDEVVVVGYGQQSRRTLTGSVASIDQSVFKSVPRTNVGTALQGTAPGIRVQQTTGQPGATPSIVFRGGTDFNGSGSPLVVLDGVIVPSLFGINMEDVESIDLLKDAASTAIYGARASNGVILVTTRKGKKGRTSVTYSYKTAQNNIRRNPLPYMSAEDYIRWNRRGLASRYEAAQADNNVAEMNNARNQLTGAWGWGLNSGWTAPDGKYSTQLVTNANRRLLSDPQYRLLIDRNPFNPTQLDSIVFRSTSQRELEDLILQQSTLKEHYLNVAGGNDQGNFALGLGGIKDNGILIGSSLSRINMNFNGGLNVGKNLVVNLNLSGYDAKTSPSYLTADGDGGLTGGVIQRFTGIAPTVRLTHDVTGAILPGVDGSTLGNPAYFQDKFFNQTLEQRYTGGLNVEYTIMPGLKALASASGYYRYTTGESFTKAYINGTGGALINTRNASFANQRESQYQYNGFLQYAKEVGKHNLTVLAGGEFYEFRRYNYGATANLGATDFIPWLSASTAAVGVPTSSFSSWQRLASIIGRVNYTFDNRYLLTVNARYDGTSKLITNRYGFFPGVSLGWNLHFEDFYAKLGVSRYINTIKPRISWGENGSINPLGSNGLPLIGDYATIPQYGSVGIYNGQPGFAAGAITNTDLRWERANTLNFGLDLGLLNNRVTIIADYFIRNVYDKISTLNIPAWTGYSTYVTNVGQLQNRGIELDIRTNIIRPSKPGGLAWNVNANLFHVRNYAVKLPNNGLDLNRQGSIQVYDPAQGRLVWVAGLQEGKRVGLDEIWAPAFDGVYKSQADLDARANFVNTYLPYINKRIKLLGDARWRDADQNDTLDFRDNVFVGRTTPTIQGGFSSSVSWKGFTLYGQFDYSLGFVIANQMYLRGMSQVQGSQNGPADVTQTWTPDNPSATLPRYYWANYGRNYFTDAGGNSTPPANYWQKGDYLAMREVTISYDAPTQLMERLVRNRIKSLRVFLTGSNLVYFTGYNGTFPEVGGNDVGRFPLPRTITLGATIGL
ncbi:SusC/RagA family TonB-linked outer membrane protein [Fibrella sp. HMF5335]|uniref:SusC/RagA family TonB-linked outer membrane protein n=1 Tax=Fibrella rubiginis TaxID=2817060 RepID=A0A939K4N3_9BACT|nr:SusC/RagA family TonB-linked outer membrane protein [Fibrella rubiginis]MBO0936371.1 SusC/RagA family TonB-linked outer membrane protein [Fibrella rubiginis]